MNLVEKERLCRHELDEFLDLIGLDSSAFPADVEAALHFLHDHLFEESLNASRVQEQDGLRSHNLPARFRRYLGLGLRDYIEDRRIMAAMRLLWYRELEVYFVAASVGYAHHETFTRAFKRRVGCTPTQFRAVFPASTPPPPDAPPPLPDALPPLPDAPPPLQPAEATMFITDVIGIQTGGGAPDLRVEGSATDQATVLVTVTSEVGTRSETADVGPDGAWVARFPSDGAFFTCDATLRIEARKPGDEQEQARWEGPLECADLVPPRRAEAEAVSEPVSAESTPNARPARGRDGGGDTDDTVMTVTVAAAAEGAPATRVYSSAPSAYAEEPTRRREPSRRKRAGEREKPAPPSARAAADDVETLRGEIEDLRAQLQAFRHEEREDADDRQRPTPRSNDGERNEDEQSNEQNSVLRELREEIRALRTERSDRQPGGRTQSDEGRTDEGHTDDDREERDEHRASHRDRDDDREQRDERSLPGQAAAAMQEQIDALKRELRSQRDARGETDRDEGETRASADDQTEAKESADRASDDGPSLRDAVHGLQEQIEALRKQGLGSRPSDDDDAPDDRASDDRPPDGGSDLRDAVRGLQKQVEALRERSLGGQPNDDDNAAGDDPTDTNQPDAESEDDLAGQNREDLYEAVQLLRQRIVDLERHGDREAEHRDDRRDEHYDERRSRTERARDEVREVWDDAERLVHDDRADVPRRHRRAVARDDRRPPARRDRGRSEEVPLIQFEPVEVGAWTDEGRCEIHLCARVSHPSREPVAAELVDDRTGEVLADGRSERGTLTLSERVEVEPGRRTFTVHVTEPSPARLAFVWELDEERAQAAQRDADDEDNGEDEDAGWISRTIGAGWAVVAAAFLLLVASGVHGILRGVVTAVFVGSFGTYLALTVPRRWAKWTFAGLGLFALALLALLPFTPIVQMDSYLIVAGLAALGLAGAAGLALFKGQD